MSHENCRRPKTKYQLASEWLLPKKSWPVRFQSHSGSFIHSVTIIPSKTSTIEIVLVTLDISHDLAIVLERVGHALDAVLSGEEHDERVRVLEGHLADLALDVRRQVRPHDVRSPQVRVWVVHVAEQAVAAPVLQNHQLRLLCVF